MFDSRIVRTGHQRELAAVVSGCLIVAVVGVPAAAHAAPHLAASEGGALGDGVSAATAKARSPSHALGKGPVELRRGPQYRLQVLGVFGTGQRVGATVLAVKRVAMVFCL